MWARWLTLLSKRKAKTPIKVDMDTRIWKHLLGFLLIVGGMAAVLEWRYKNYVTVPDILYYKLEEDGSKYTHLYIGNSHIGAFHAYNPDSNAKVRNLSLQGQDLFKEWVALKKWLPKMPNVKTVVLGLDYEIIGQNQTLSGEEFLDRQFFRYTDTLYRYSFSNVMMAKSSFFRSNRDIKYLFSNGDNMGDPSKMDLNFIPVESRKKVTDAECRKRALEHSLIKFKKAVIPENEVYLERIISLCKERNVKLLVINTPKSECYKGYLYRENSNYAKQQIDSVLSANGIHYYDFDGDPMFAPDDYADYDHITYDASKKLLDSLFTYAHPIEATKE